MGTSTHERPVGASHGGGPTSILDWSGPVWAEVALVEDRVTAAALTGAVGERTKASVDDLTDKQLDDRGRVVVQGGDGEVEVGREPPGGSGVDLSERGAPLEGHEGEDPAFGQVAQQQTLGDVDDRGIATLWCCLLYTSP